MKTMISAALATALFASAASAQTADQTSQNDAVKDNSVAQVAIAAEGSNSFTEDQAKERIATAGYTHISHLVKDEKGVWRGAAMHKGKRVNVGLDYKGNVSTTEPTR